MRPPSPVWRFALWVLLLVGPCFALWYALAPWYDRPAAWLAGAAIGFFGTDVVQSLAFDDRVVAFMTTLEARGSAGERGLLTVEVNPLLYTFGAPLPRRRSPDGSSRPRRSATSWAPSSCRRLPR